jgi:hypothetical protein
LLESAAGNEQKSKRQRTAALQNLAEGQALIDARQRLGVRLSSAAFGRFSARVCFHSHVTLLKLIPLVRRGLLPQIDWFFGVGLKRKRHFTTGACGFVSGENNFENSAGVFTSDERWFVVFDAVDEVSHFVDEAVVPDFFVNGE